MNNLLTILIAIISSTFCIATEKYFTVATGIPITGDGPQRLVINALGLVSVVLIVASSVKSVKKGSKSSRPVCIHATLGFIASVLSEVSSHTIDKNIHLTGSESVFNGMMAFLFFSLGIALYGMFAVFGLLLSIKKEDN